jgi:phenylacetyl-CoA:acceptor oxidoreductase subunit 2
MSEGYFRPEGWVQRHWDARAAANFMLGGTGAGLLIACALLAAQAPTLTAGAKAGIGLGLALIATGLAAVWLEIGRKLRAANVFFNPRTSWMTRESYAAIVVFALGIAALAGTDARLAVPCALAALVFVWCQGWILRASKGIPAWRAPEVGALIVTTALAEGAGLATVGAAVLSDALEPALGLLALALLARALAWTRYRAAVRKATPRQALAPLEIAGKGLLQLGTVAPLALGLVAFAVPAAAPAAATLAGLAALAAGWRLKFVLVTRAAWNQGFALPHLPVRGVR